MHGLFGWTEIKMASKQSEDSKKETIVLFEEDIPGAALPRDSVEACSVVQLKRWLTCRGAKVSGKKNALINRVKHYIDNGLDKRYLRDPDGGVHLMKKKANLGLLDETEPQMNESFPKEGFTCDLSDIPKISFGTIWRYMIDAVVSKKQLSTAKPLVKGFNFYKSGHVLAIFLQKQNGKNYIKSQVLPSMKKGLLYQCNIVLSSIGGVLKAYCGCPAGIDGRCNHVSATLFALEEYCKEREKNSKESCTSKPCKWNIPRKRKGPVTPISNMSFKKHDYSKKQKLDRSPSITPGKDVRAEHQREWSSGKITNMLESIKAYQSKTGNVVGWSHILPQEVKEKTDDIISPLKVLPPSLNDIENQAETIKKKLNLDEDNIKNIEQKTRGQSKDELWNFHRKSRITASKCYRIASLKPTTSPTKALIEVLQYDKSYQSKQMKEGLEKEHEIERMYITSMQKSGHKNLSVGPNGLFISQSHGFLAATPDGLVTDPHSPLPLGLLEMKFIQLNDNEKLNDALLRKRICTTSENGLRMNSNHQYYYQVHQQMFVTQLKWTDFVVKGSMGNELYIEQVSFNSEFWSKVLPKLCSFFNKHMLPELSYPRVKHGLPRFSLREE